MGDLSSFWSDRGRRLTLERQPAMILEIIQLACVERGRHRGERKTLGDHVFPSERRLDRVLRCRLCRWYRRS